MQIRFAALIFVCLFAGLFALTIDQTTDAATTVPTKMNFQGQLTNSAGNIVANGNYNMKLRIYDDPSAGTLRFYEERLVSTGTSVTVTNGSFSLKINEGSNKIGTFDASLFASGSLYLEVELATPASVTSSSPVWTEGAMTPRNQLLTSAYAYNAETLDGIDGASFAQQSAANTFSGNNTFSGANGFTNTVDVSVANANALRVRNGATNLFNVDTTNSIISIGTSDTTGAVLVVDTKTNSGDPTGAAATNGAIYYNSLSNKLRCYQNSGWTDCIAAGSGNNLQSAYDNSSTPATITTSSATKGLRLAAGAAPSVDMFTIDNTGQAVTTAGVAGLQINYVGGAAAIEASGARVDFTPGTTSGGTWNGLKIVAGATGAVSGVAENGINLDGPTTPGAGMEVALNIDANWDAGLQITGKSAEPPTPTGDNVYVYAQRYAGRTILAQKGASGVAYAYQPALFEQTVSMVTPGNAGTMLSLGQSYANTASNTPTTAASETLGFSTIYATSATASNASGVGETAASHYRGATANGANGYFNVSRVSFPDSGGYGSGTTGSRIFVGMSSAALATSAATMVNADSPSAHYSGFQYSTNRGDTNWQFMTNNAGTANVVNTGMAFAINKIYDMYVYVAPLGGTIYWRIDNLTDGTRQENSTTTSVPGTTTPLRSMAEIQTLTTTARTMRMNKIYVESDQ